jgi:hypothetical protein
MEFSQVLFPSGTDFWLLIIGFVLLVGIPFLALVIAGFALLFGLRPPKYTGIAMAAIWVLGMILTAVGGLRTGVEFNKDSSISEVIQVNETGSDTLYFDILDNKGLVRKNVMSSGDFEFLQLKEGVLTLDGIEVNVLSTNSSFAELEIIREAKGNSFEKADRLASSIVFNTTIDSNIIKIDPYFQLDKGDKWRGQEIKVNLYLPNGKTIFIPKSYKYLIYDIKNYHDTYDRNMVNMYWTMTDSGLVSPKLMKREKLNRLNSQREPELEKLELIITDGEEEHSIVIH